MPVATMWKWTTCPITYWHHPHLVIPIVLSSCCLLSRHPPLFDEVFVVTPHLVAAASVLPLVGHELDMSAHVVTSLSSIGLNKKKSKPHLQLCIAIWFMWFMWFMWKWGWRRWQASCKPLGVLRLNPGWGNMSPVACSLVVDENEGLNT